MISIQRKVAIVSLLIAIFSDSFSRALNFKIPEFNLRDQVAIEKVRRSFGKDKFESQIDKAAGSPSDFFQVGQNPQMAQSVAEANSIRELAHKSSEEGPTKNQLLSRKYRDFPMDKSSLSNEIDGVKVNGVIDLDYLRLQIDVPIGRRVRTENMSQIVLDQHQYLKSKRDLRSKSVLKLPGTLSATNSNSISNGNIALGSQMYQATKDPDRPPATTGGFLRLSDLIATQDSNPYQDSSLSAFSDSYLSDKILDLKSLVGDAMAALVRSQQLKRQNQLLHRQSYDLSRRESKENQTKLLEVAESLQESSNYPHSNIGQTRNPPAESLRRPIRQTVEERTGSDLVAPSVFKLQSSSAQGNCDPVSQIHLSECVSAERSIGTDLSDKFPASITAIETDCRQISFLLANCWPQQLQQIKTALTTRNESLQLATDFPLPVGSSDDGDIHEATTTRTSCGLPPSLTQFMLDRISWMWLNLCMDSKFRVEYVEHLACLSSWTQERARRVCSQEYARMEANLASIKLSKRAVDPVGGFQHAAGQLPLGPKSRKRSGQMIPVDTELESKVLCCAFDLFLRCVNRHSMRDCGPQGAQFVVDFMSRIGTDDMKYICNSEPKAFESRPVKRMGRNGVTIHQGIDPGPFIESNYCNESRIQSVLYGNSRYQQNSSISRARNSNQPHSKNLQQNKFAGSRNNSNRNQLSHHSHNDFHSGSGWANSKNHNSGLAHHLGFTSVLWFALLGSTLFHLVITRGYNF